MLDAKRPRNGSRSHTSARGEPMSRDAPPRRGAIERLCAGRRKGGRDDGLRFFLDAPQVVGPLEAFRVDLVDVLGARRAGGEPAVLGHDLSPPMGAPFPGALVSFPRIGSPASVAARTSPGERALSTCRCLALAGASILV